MWKLNDRRDPLNMGSLEDCVMDLIDAARGLYCKEDIRNDKQGVILRRAVRKIAIPIRKMMIENDGQLLKTCVADPKIHRLSELGGPNKIVEITFSTPKRNLVYGLEDGTKHSIVVPAAKHTVIVERLYGIERIASDPERNVVNVNVRSPFDLVQEPVGIDEWMNTRIMQANSVSYAPNDLLKLTANAEGAHAGQYPSLAMAGVKPERIDRSVGMKYRVLNTVVFGQLTYPQIFTLVTGLYLLERSCELLEHAIGYLDRADKSSIAREIRSLGPNPLGIVNWICPIGCTYNEMIRLDEQPENPDTMLRIRCV